MRLVRLQSHRTLRARGTVPDADRHGRYPLAVRADDRRTQTRALLFDLQVEASLDALIVRGWQAGIPGDEQAMTIALACSGASIS